MSKTAIWPFVFIALWACNKEVAIDDTAPQGECMTDTECDGPRICTEDLECELGDRNNSLEDAVDITLNNPLSEVLQDPADADWFKYTTLEPRWLRIETRAVREDTEMDTVLSVHDESGALHAFVDDFGTGTPVSCCDSLLHVYLPTAGVWYLQVTDGPGGGASSYEYEIEAREFGFTTVESDSFETPARELELDEGGVIWTVGVNLEEPGDEDYIGIDFGFDGTSLRVLALENMPGSDSQVVVEILDENEEVVSRRENVGVDGAEAQYYLMTAGNWVVRTSDRLGNADTSGSYWHVLYFRTSEPEDYSWVTEVEPNDDQSEAIEVENVDRETSGGTPYQAGYGQGALDEDFDEDWYAIEVPEGHFFSAECYGDQVGALADLALDLYDESGTLVDTATDGNGSDTTPFLQNMGDLESPAQTRYVRIYSEDDAVWGPGAFYRCNFFMTTFEVGG